MRCGARCAPGGRRVWGSGGSSGVHRERPDSRREGQGTRGAHVEHVAHARDLGGVKAQRLVKRKRVLPSRTEGHAMRGEVRAGRREGVRRRRRKRRARGRPDSRLLGARARAERTWNM